MLVILYTAYKVLNSIELTMNDIWGVRRRRPMLRRVIDYLAVVFVFPLMLLVTALLAAALKTPQVQSVING
ncbi:YhjD/YihY/BrkB family envelope integrity protein, partial [Campylobacter jejuni]